MSRPGVRITGIRLEGPSTVIAPPDDCSKPEATGVRASGSDVGLQIDNNEIWGWPGQAIDGLKTQALHVHDNHIHHNRRELVGSKTPGCGDYGRGYGVHVGTGAHAIIERNIFDYNRHDIASNGDAGTVYHAQYNLVLGGGIGHSFDVHEDNESDQNGGTGKAGYYFAIHHNTFQQNNYASIRIRAVPELGADVYDNEFMNHGCRVFEPELASVQQKLNGEYRCSNFENMNVGSNAELVDYLPGLFASFSGTSFWSFRKLEAPSLSQIAFGDFDDEPGEDAFRATGVDFEISSRAKAGWTRLTTSGVAFDDLGFGNFGEAPRELGASKTDVIREYRGQWKVWINGAGSDWQWLNTSQMGGSLRNLRFADFDGNGRTDVFKRNSGRWQVSWDGQSSWQPLGSSSYHSGNLEDLAFGNFDSSVGMDVIKTKGGSLYISHGGTTPWYFVRSVGVNMSQLRLADVNGDGITDLVKTEGGRWWVSWSGTSMWLPLKYSSLAMSELEFADLNGDGMDDFISRQTP